MYLDMTSLYYKPEVIFAGDMGTLMLILYAEVISS